ncbi:MAG TPA: acetyl-CoA carboxylase biotin carboxylase subunit, partial [Fimbriimonadaceae bacterium]|nr:acetyl-CoA carboxylase biotin carboxylase subunit [Fimbriimonadaceae bacterium]
MLKKVLIANRGEIACRVIRACRELGIQSVAIYSQADRDSLHVKIADEAICVGAGTNTESYLNLANVLMAAEISGAEAVHPGYGYFSERASFAEALDSLGIKFVGPPVKAIEAMGDKASAKTAAIAANCPVVPGSDGSVPTDLEALKAAESIGYPILLKAIAGGGGRGIRRVDDPDDLSQLWKMAQAEAQASFGNGDIMLEKCVVEPRHVEIQIIGDAHGNMIYLGERECSIQNLRHQKMIEEAPYAQLPAEVRRAMGEAAVRVAWSVGYQNAGTVEFLVDSDNKFYFLEMNTRLQVEHPVTEEVTGLDLVHLQLKIASGERLPIKQEDVRYRAHAIEVRITAQDPDKDFAPSTGKITQWRAPGGRGVRMDTHCYAGLSVSPYYDPLLAKLIVFGRDREEAVRRVQSALHEF